LGKRLTKVQDKLSDADDESERLRREIAALKAKPVQPQKNAAPTQQTTAAKAPQQPRENRPTTPTTSPTETQADAKPTAGAVVTEAEEGAAQPPEKKPPEQADAADVASTSASPAPEESLRREGNATDTAVSGPRRSATVQLDLQAAIADAEGVGPESDDKGKAKGKAKDKSRDKNNHAFTLLENLGDARPTVTLGPTGASRLLNASLTPRAGKWELAMAKKLAARISYDKADKALVIEIFPGRASLHGLQFLTLTVETKNNETVSIPLGSPTRAAFALRETSDSHYTFFDDDTNALVDTLYKELKDVELCASLTFARESGIIAFTKESDDLPDYMKGMPSLVAGQIALVKEDAEKSPTGVVLKRDTSQRAVYVWEERKYVIDPSRVKELGKDLDLPPWDWCVVPVNEYGRGLIPAVSLAREQKMKTEGVEPSNDPAVEVPRLVRRNELVVQEYALTSYINENARLARNFVTGDLAKPRPVRFELKVAGFDDGLVIVDSLNANDTKR